MKLWEKIKEANKLECGERCWECVFNPICLRGRKVLKHKIEWRLLYLSLFFSICFFGIGIVSYHNYFLFIFWNVLLSIVVVTGYFYLFGLIIRMAKRDFEIRDSASWEVTATESMSHIHAERSEGEK